MARQVLEGSADAGLVVGLFPRQAAPAELQGGEQKTFTVFVDVGAGGAADLAWVHDRSIVSLPPEDLAASGAIAHLVPSPNQSGVQRTCGLRRNTMPVGPQYSTVFGNTSPSMNRLLVCPAPNSPSSAHTWRTRMVVSPASSPTPNRSNSKMVFSSPRSVGM